MVGNDAVDYIDVNGTEATNSKENTKNSVICVYRWVWITHYNHKIGNRDNTLKRGDYATSDVNPKERNKNDSCKKKSYYPSNSRVCEFGNNQQDGQIADTGDGGRLLKMQNGTLPYGSWLDRWTDDKKLCNLKTGHAYWAKVLICWPKSECPCEKSPIDSFEANDFESAKKLINYSDQMIPIGPDNKPSKDAPKNPIPV